MPEVITIKGRRERVMFREKDVLITLALRADVVQEQHYEMRDGEPEFQIGFDIKPGYVDGPGRPGLGACGLIKPTEVISYSQGIELLAEVGIVA